MDIRDIGLGGMDCSVLVQEMDQSRALVNVVMKFGVL
jgi:hypothetical protein